VNIDGIDPGKWEQITNMSVFPQLDIIILTEHHLSATFRPAYIVESGWDILMVEGPPKQGHLSHIDRGGVAILWKNSANWEVKQEIVSNHTSHQSEHQCVTWTIRSKHFSHPIHMTGVYISPNGTGTEEFYHILEQQRKFSPLHTHVFTGDFNAHVAEEPETAPLSLPAGTVPPHLGDVARDDASRLLHPPAPAKMGTVTDHATSAQRGRLLLRILNNIGYIILNGRFEPSSHPNSLPLPPPYTLQRRQGRIASIIDYCLISVDQFQRAKSCNVISPQTITPFTYTS
jgi:hypothetical protein